MTLDLDPRVELVDVGWIVWEAGAGEELRGGTVVEVREDPIADSRTFVIVDAFHGRTRFLDFDAHGVDPTLIQLPNNAVIRSHIRRMQREAGASKGAVDSWQVRLTTTALRLIEVLQ